MQTLGNNRLEVSNSRFDVGQINRLLVSRSPERSETLGRESGDRPTITKKEVRNWVRFLLGFPPSLRQQTVLRRYNRAAVKLAEMRQATQKLVRVIIDQSFDFTEMPHLRGNEDVVGTMRDLLGEFYDVEFTIPGSVKSLDLLNEPALEIYKKLDAHLEQSVDLFVDELFSLFSTMIERHVLGRIRYGGRKWRNCELTYFRSKVVPKSQEKRNVKYVADKGASVPYFRDGEWWKKKTAAMRFLETGVVTVQHVRGRHLLSNVRTIPLDCWGLPLPERIVPVFEAIPSFLRQWATVVQGNLEGELIVAADVGEAPYSYTGIHEVEEEIRHFDPAIGLGPGILTCWCPDEQPRTGLGRRLAAGAWHRLVARKGGK